MLHEKTRRLAAAANFAVLATRLPDGAVQGHVMWIDCDEDHLYINTEVHRRKFANLERDPRVTVTIVDRNDPYSFVEVRGRVVGTTRGSEARHHIDTLSMKYLGKPYSTRIQSERVMLKIAADREVIH
ncbi:MAG: TIGR03618 family F420-dependent PPOX class oxidoreductase [Acidimicrobiia bacterium]|nr:TIGR03618 family F420-dependent PPOX class oxidoreductase [Acidimicrobiia bacterium]